jgi:1-acyl-sn-glycerol-3-phosphate acyltransferase
VEPVYRAVIGAVLATFKLQRWEVQVTGHQHVPDAGGAVIASNHISYLDFIFDGYAVREATRDKRLVRFAAKKEAFDHPVSGPLMRAMHHLPVDRAGAASDTIDHAVELLRRGELVGMFPEATISRSFVPLEAKTGTVRMAQRAGVPIVPVAVWGSHRLFTKGQPRDLRQRDVLVTVDIGAPMATPAETDPGELTGTMMERIGELVAHAQERYPQRPADGEPDWWVPAHLGGSAPTPAEAQAVARQEAERRRARRAQPPT